MHRIVTMLALVGSAAPVLCWILTLDPGLQALGSRLVLTAFLVAPVALAKLDLDGFAESGILFDLRTFTSLEGCAGRLEYWATVLFVLALDIVAVSFLALLLAPFVRSIGGLVLLVAGADFLALAAVSVRRLHDAGAAGWWLALPPVACAALVGIGLPAAPVAGGVELALLLVAGCLAEGRGAERFETGVRAMSQEEMDEDLPAPGSQHVYTPTTAPSDPKATLGAYLTKLSEMHERGEISEEDYTAQVNALMGGADAPAAEPDTWLPLEERVQRTVTSSRATRFLTVGSILLALAAIAGSLFFLRWFSRAME